MGDAIQRNSPATTSGEFPNAGYRPAPAEWVAVFVFLIAMFVVNVLSYNLYPTVWADEILWSDPAINLVNTGHFTTSVWGLQPAGAFWAAQSPLYCFILSGWLPFVGQTLLAVRSLNYLLISIATILVWFGSWKFRLLSRPLHRLAILPLLLLGFGISFCYRSARPDITGMLCLICLGLAFSARNRRSRDILLLLCAISAPWIGIQDGLYAGVACFLAKLVFRAVSWRDLMIVWGGICVGGLSMLLFFYAHGVLPAFMSSLSQASHEQTKLAQVPSYLESVPRRLHGSFGIYVDDFSCIPLVPGFICFWLCSRTNLDKDARRVAAFLLLLALGIPVIFSFTAHFAFYYAYMVYVPLVLAFLILCSQASNTARRGAKRFAGAVFTISVLGAIAVGLPLRLFLAESFCRIVPRADYAKIIRAQIKPDDVVFSDYPDFFEARPCAQRVYSPMYCAHFAQLSFTAHDFTEEEKRNITVLIIAPDSAENMKQYFGGKWSAVTGPFGDSCPLEKIEKIPLIGGRLKHHLQSPQSARYQLQIWRRSPG